MKALKISVTAVLIALVGFFSFAVNAEENNDFSVKIEKFNALDITAIDIEAAGITPDSTVSREAFAKIAARIMNSNFENIVSYESGTDLAESDKGMQYLKTMGIVVGNGNGVYEPDRNITMPEAVKIFGCVMGYSFGFDENTAHSVGLLKGVGPYENSHITYAQLITMLDNLIELDVLVMEDTEGSYKKTDVSVLEHYKKTLMGKGILQEYDNCSIYSYEGPGKGNAVINDELFATGKIDCREDIGKQIEFYYAYEDGEYILKYIMPARNEIKVLNHNDGLSYDSGVYHYYEDDGKKMQTVSISDETIYMYNGKKAETIADFTPDCGTVTLIDNNNDGQYDILSITDKKLVVVASTIESDLEIIDEYDANSNVKLASDSCKEYYIYDVNGTELHFADILKGDVLEVEKSQGDRPVIKITVVREVVSGAIEATALDDLGEVTINAKIYKASETFKALVKANEMTKAYRLGSECTAYLNSFGEIVYMTSVDYDEYRTGYLVAVREILGLQNYIEVQLLDQSGTVELLTFADRVKTDTKTYKQTEIEQNTFASKSLVRFKTDIHGDIAELYYPSTSSKTFKTVCEGSWYFRRSAFGRFFAKKYGENNFVLGCTLDANAVIFHIAGNDPYNYSVLTPTQLTTATDYNIVGYNTSGIPGIADIVLVKANNQFGFLNQSGRKAAAINKVYVKLGDDGEVRPVIDVLIDGVVQTVEIDDNRSSGGDLPFGVGDVISFARVNNRLLVDDSASAYSIMVDYTDSGLTVPRTGYKYSQTSYTTDGTLRYGPVYDVEGELILINPIDIANDDTIDAIDTSATTVRVYIYDEELKEFREGEVSEARGYKNNPTDYSMAYTMANFDWGIVVIYP